MSRAASPEQLFEHSAWILALARSLVKDPATADDVAQQTMIAALQTPPSTDRPLRPWLGQVTRSFAGKWWRSESRRRQHEAAASPTEQSSPSSAELAESADTLQALMAELGSLDDDLREVISLRYMRDLNSAEISRQLGIPAGTVRWRLKQGLDVLRERLDARHGDDRSRWTAALIGLLGKGNAPILVAGSATSLRGLFLLAAALLCGIGAWTFGTVFHEADSASHALASTTVEPRTANGSTAITEPGKSSRDQQKRSRVIDTGPQPAFTLDASQAGVSARIVDSDGRALAIAQLQWSDGLDTIGFSDIEGQAAFRFRPPTDNFSAQFVLKARDHAARIISGVVTSGAWLDLGTIELPRSRTIRGQVVDAQNMGVGNVSVLATPSDLAGHPEIYRDTGPEGWAAYRIEPVVTRADGSFSLRGLPDEALRIWCGDVTSRFTYSSPVAAATIHDPIRLTLQPLPAHAQIIGTITTADGTMTSARVRYRERGRQNKRKDAFAWLSRPRWIEADVDGRFVVPARPGKVYDLLIEDDAGAWQDVEQQASAGDRISVRMNERLN